MDQRGYIIGEIQLKEKVIITIVLIMNELFRIPRCKKKLNRLDTPFKLSMKVLSMLKGIR